VVPAAYSVIDDVVVWNQERRRRGERLREGLAGAWSRRTAARHARGSAS
jgi:hypothetical protein